MNYVPTHLEKAISVDAIYTIHYFEYTKDFAYSGEMHDFWEIVYADKKSVAYSIVLQSDAKTLTDEECNAVMNKVFRALEQVGAHLRT